MCLEPGDGFGACGACHACEPVVDVLAVLASGEGHRSGCSSPSAAASTAQVKDVIAEWTKS